MKLAEWFDTPSSDGSRKSKADFAARIDVTPQMISAYCSDTWPGKKRMEAIVRETNGEVTANDFIEMPKEAAQ